MTGVGDRRLAGMGVVELLVKMKECFARWARISYQCWPLASTTYFPIPQQDDMAIYSIVRNNLFNCCAGTWFLKCSICIVGKPNVVFRFNQSQIHQLKKHLSHSAVQQQIKHTYSVQSPWRDQGSICKCCAFILTIHHVEHDLQGFLASEGSYCCHCTLKKNISRKSFSIHWKKKLQNWRCFPHCKEISSRTAWL